MNKYVINQSRPVQGVGAGLSGISGVSGTSHATGPVTQFVVVANTTALLGFPTSISFMAADANGNRVTGYRGTVHFTSTDGASFLPSNSTFNAINAGKQTKGITFRTAGDQTVTATDVATSSITGTSNICTVSTPPPSTPFSATKFSAPGTLPEGSVKGIAIGVTKDYFVYATLTTPFFGGYAVSRTGFGTKITAPAISLPDSGRSIHVNQNGTVVIVGSAATPWVYAYVFDKVTGFGTKYADPADISSLGTIASKVKFCPDGNAVLCTGSTNSPYIFGWQWTDDGGFGTRFAAPSTTAGQGATCLEFHPAGTAVVATTQTTSPWILGWPFSSTTGFGTQFSAPASLPAGSVSPGGLAISPTGKTVIIATSTSPYVYAYPFDPVTGFGAKFANPGALPNFAGGGVCFNGDGSLVFVGGNTPFVEVYDWDDTTGWGSKHSAVTAAGGVTAENKADSDNVYLHALASSPFINGYS